MSEDILEAIDIRDTYLKINDHENYKTWQSNNVVNLIQRAKCDYYINLIEMSKEDSKLMWKYLRKLDPKSSTPPPPKLKYGEKDIIDPVDIQEVPFL